MVLNFVIVVVFAFFAGIVQSVSGFGNAIVMMLGYPSIFGITPGAAVSGSIGIANNAILTYKFKDGLNKKTIKKTLIIAVIYTLIGILIINCTKYLNVRVIGLAYGIFLVLLAGYFIFLDGKIDLTGTFWMLFSSIISGIGTGLFSIGGPLLAVYLSKLYEKREEYIANAQLVFLLGNLVSLITRIVNGIYTSDMIKYSVAGLVAIYAGSLVGIKLTKVIKPKTVKTIMYVLVLISGIMTIVKHI